MALATMTLTIKRLVLVLLDEGFQLTCAISMWRNDMKYIHVYIYIYICSLCQIWHVKTIVYSLFMSDKKYHFVSVKFISIRSLQSFSCNHLVKYWPGAKLSFPENWSYEWKTINAMVLCLLFTIPVHSATAFHHAAGAPNVIIYDLFQTA